MGGRWAVAQILILIPIPYIFTNRSKILKILISYLSRDNGIEICLFVLFTALKK